MRCPRRTSVTGLDDLLVFSLADRSIRVYESRRPGLDSARFWGWYGPAYLGITADDEISMARYTVSGFDALVIQRASGTGNRGAVRAFSVAYPPTEITTASSIGDMQTSSGSGFTGNVHLVWGDTASVDGNVRDDTFQFFDDVAQYRTYYAYPGSPPWWRYWFYQNTNYLKYELGLL
jgi:hypothetical protein